MHAAISTVAFRGIDTIPVEVQVHIADGLPAMAIVGLANKAAADRTWSAHCNGRNRAGCCGQEVGSG